MSVQTQRPDTTLVVTTMITSKHLSYEGDFSRDFLLGSESQNGLMII